jgi:excisionase family DNA binding protein
MTNHESAQRRLLTVPEAAATLNVSEGWLRKGILTRSIPFTKIGRSVRFTPAHLEQIVAAGEQVPVQRAEDRPAGRGSARTRL